MPRLAPSSKLLWWVGIVVLPFSVLAALVPETTFFGLASILLLVTVVGLDAARAWRSLEGIDVTLPKTVSLFKDRPGAIELQIRNQRQRARRLRLGLALPREIPSLEDDLIALLPGGTEYSRVAWPCVPAQRGAYRIDRCYLEGQSPHGFWAVRNSTRAEAEIRVYPNLLTERKSVAALFLHRGSLGIHIHRQVGKGREFEKLREYLPGDSFEDIHWKATAKRGRPVTKVYQIERTQQVYVIIDASRLSSRSADGLSGEAEAKTKDQGPRTKDQRPRTTDYGLRTYNRVTVNEISVLERFITAALVLGVAAEQQGDLFGLLTFSDKVENFVRAKNGKAHYGACRDALYTLQPRLVTPDFDELCAFIRTKVRRRALLIFLTALDDPLLAESFVRNVELISRQHLVLVSMMQPPGVQPLFSDPRVDSVDGLYRALAGHQLWHDLRELEKILQRRGVGFSLVPNEQLSAQLVTQYLSVKRRQLL